MRTTNKNGSSRRTTGLGTGKGTSDIANIDEIVTAPFMNPVLETITNSIIQEKREDKEEIEVSLTVNVPTLEVLYRKALSY